ncbi:MAG TPA: hypothetical protein VJG90_02520 [Candidatus Nanoarchaeia archaeon]|nr:hypothetical protein [Candidatus Nanoarchaeia archaeon]
MTDNYILFSNKDFDPIERIREMQRLHLTISASVEPLATLLGTVKKDGEGFKMQYHNAVEAVRLLKQAREWIQLELTVSQQLKEFLDSGPDLPRFP